MPPTRIHRREGKAQELTNGDILHMGNGNYVTISGWTSIGDLLDDAPDAIDITAQDGTSYVRRRGDHVDFLRPER